MADSKTLCRVFAVACPPLVPTAPPSPRCEACHWIFGSLCSPTNPVPLPPRKSGGTTTRALLRATFETTVSRSFIVPPLAGERWWRQPPKGGAHFPRPKSGCMVFSFSHGRSPVVKVSYILAPSIILKAPTTTLSGEAAVKPENPRGESPVKPRPRSGRQPSRP